VISRCVREEHIHAFRRELLTFISGLSAKLWLQSCGVLDNLLEVSSL
jgi:hypothetical protein